MELIWLVPALPLAGFRPPRLRSLRCGQDGRRHRQPHRRPFSAPRACVVAWLFASPGRPARPPTRPACGPGSTRIGLAPAIALLGRRPLRRHDPGRHDRRLPHPSLLDRAYGGRGRLSPLLRLHEPLRGLHADPRARRQLPPPLPGMGRRRTLQLPPHRFLVPRPGERRRRAQGLHRHARRRRRPPAGDPPDRRRPRQPRHQASIAARAATLGAAGSASPCWRPRSSWAGARANRPSSPCRPGCPTRWPAPRP